MATAIEAWWSWSKLQEISKRQNSMEKNPWKYRRHLCDLLKMGVECNKHAWYHKGNGPNSVICVVEIPMARRTLEKGTWGWKHLMLKDLCSFVSVTFLLSMLFSEKNSLDSFCLDWTGWSTIDTNWSSDCSGYLLQSSLKPFLQWMQAWRLQNWCLLDTLRLFTSWAKCWNLRSRKKTIDQTDLGRCHKNYSLEV